MKIPHIAIREFKATVMTKAFLIGVLVVPLIIFGLVPVAMLLSRRTPPPVEGTVAVIDRSGGASEEIKRRLSPEALAERVSEFSEQVKEAAKRFSPGGKDGKGAPAGADAATEMALKMAAGEAPKIAFELLPPDTDVEAAKAPLTEGTTQDAGRLALIVVAPDAIRQAPGSEDFGSFEFFVRNKLDARAQGLIGSQVRDGIVQARIAANGEDPERIRSLMRLPTPDATTVTKQGDKGSTEAAQFFVPLGFMMLLWISVFTGGQYLLTSTIEEKSNRVMEVLLSAASPMQLMTGKIIGQMGAGLLILCVYSGVAIVGLIAFGMLFLVSPLHVVFLVVFFFLAYFMIASMMAAVGSAVTDVHEAQTLLTPVMLLVMTPMFMMMPIISNPNGKLATVMSFVPPINPFVMVLRIASTEPPPTWQILASMGVGFVGVYVLLRLAAKVFRIGVLMYGKPPNFKTLIKWVRMA